MSRSQIQLLIIFFSVWGKTLKKIILIVMFQQVYVYRDRVGSSHYENERLFSPEGERERKKKK